MQPEFRYEDGKWLPKGHGSLANGVPRSVAGAVSALALSGGYSVRPREGRVVYFGRNRPEVHVCIGEDDRQVSRQQGVLTYQRGHWWLSNTGRRPIRVRRSQWLFANDAAIPLANGFTPLFVPGSGDREHLLEVYVTGPDGSQPLSRHDAETEVPRPHRLTPEERLILIVLGQRYLLHEPNAKPLTWQQAAEQLAELRPAAGWTKRKVEHRVAAVRDRLSRSGVPGLTREEVGEPVGNSLNDNLIKELVRSTTLVPPDLAALDPR
ncbi:FHA domain-containing protein [Goodfellowiella coeruleoviolacea]|uniref:FHA domain-containing protein n=1 Tax=Goodfellowiella coeruleoviolacea TaxID=334858 RepID=A0AAE3GA34_9PSEU|nr:FHA domain-containing protein [Goodfellowiella coeruleoviolacea]MCP2164471.1 hypothetical protein [Goodfellowiella coeruleoviolacea]